MVFEQRFLRGLPQLDPILDALVCVLLDMCDQYDTHSANSIISATFEFINTTCLEPALKALKPIRGATLFPWFLRDRTGDSVAYALMIFPESRNLDFVARFQALPYMNIWISLTNDILSYVFHTLVLLLLEIDII